ncbi:MAG: DUF998 domain-containing protein [Gammaproteobacteria bacterium]|nr:DUF998 domain-containing protein [Gammaproteobacteria bacterium]
MSHNNDLVISYLTLREAIGFMGLSLPLVLWVGGLIEQDAVQPSISHYYHTGLQDIFVGYLFAISVFLMAYRGYEATDLWCGKVAGLSGIGVALFPTMKGLEQCTGEAVSSGAALFSKIHLGSALVFFSILAVFCFALFTKSKPGVPPTPMKLWRNRVYRSCGTVIIGSLVMIVVVTLMNRGNCPTTSLLPPVFAFESLAILAFGLSWVVKGEAILTDR